MLVFKPQDQKKSVPEKGFLLSRNRVVRAVAPGTGLQAGGVSSTAASAVRSWKVKLS